MPALAISNLDDFDMSTPGAMQDGQPTDQSLEALYQQTSQDLLRGTGHDTFEAMRVLESIRKQAYRPAHGARYPNSALGTSLKQIAQLIKADVGLEMRIYPGQSLYEATEQWPAMTRGRLDISVFPLAYASGRHPEFNLTLMPGLVTSHDHAARANDSPYMDEIRRLVEVPG